MLDKVLDGVFTALEWIGVKLGLCSPIEIEPDAFTTALERFTNLVGVAWQVYQDAPEADKDTVTSIYQSLSLKSIPMPILSSEHRAYWAQQVDKMCQDVENRLAEYMEGVA